MDCYAHWTEPYRPAAFVHNFFHAFVRSPFRTQHLDAKSVCHSVSGRIHVIAPASGLVRCLRRDSGDSPAWQETHRRADEVPLEGQSIPVDPQCLLPPTPLCGAKPHEDPQSESVYTAGRKPLSLSLSLCSVAWPQSLPARAAHQAADDPPRLRGAARGDLALRRGGPGVDAHSQ
eukprot:gene12070-biopygen2